MAKGVERVKRGIIYRMDKVATETCRDTALFVVKEAEKRATLDPNEIDYSIYAGYDNIGQFDAYLSNFKWDGRVHHGFAQGLSNDGTYETRVYNDYLVFVKRLGTEVPFGNLLEWGTGVAGYGSPVGDYWTEVWDERTAVQRLEIGTFGMSPQPHWTPAVKAGQDEIVKILGQKMAQYFGGK